MPSEPDVQRRVVPIPGNAFSSDDVYYRAGLLVARLQRSQPQALHILADNVTLDALDDGTPVLIEVEGGKEYTWGHRNVIEIAVPVRPGQVLFQGPIDYDYWFDEPAVVASNMEETDVVVEFGENPPSEGIRISPRTTVFYDRLGRLSAFIFTDISMK